MVEPSDIDNEEEWIKLVFNNKINEIRTNYSFLCRGRKPRRCLCSDVPWGWHSQETYHPMDGAWSLYGGNPHDSNSRPLLPRLERWSWLLARRCVQKWQTDRRYCWTVQGGCLLNLQSGFDHSADDVGLAMAQIRNQRGSHPAVQTLNPNSSWILAIDMPRNNQTAVFWLNLPHLREHADVRASSLHVCASSLRINGVHSKKFERGGVWPNDREDTYWKAKQLPERAVYFAQPQVWRQQQRHNQSCHDERPPHWLWLLAGHEQWLRKAVVLQIWFRPSPWWSSCCRQVGRLPLRP